jgi:hypothetical protein
VRRLAAMMGGRNADTDLEAVLGLRCSTVNLHTIADISELFRSLDKPPLAKLSFFVGC